MGAQGPNPKDLSPGYVVEMEKFGKIEKGVLTVLLGGVYIPAQRGRGAAGGC
jgi:hypothetical protein